MDIQQRCTIHSFKMHTEGWYTTANVLALAAEHIARLQNEVEQLKQALGSGEKLTVSLAGNGNDCLCRRGDEHTCMVEHCPRNFPSSTETLVSTNP